MKSFIVYEKHKIRLVAMGNILSYYLNSSSSSNSTSRVIGDNEKPEDLTGKPGEFQRRANEGDEIEQKEREANGKERANLEQEGTVPSTDITIKDFSLDLTLVNLNGLTATLASLDLSTTSEIVKTLEMNVINAYIDVSKACLNLIVVACGQIEGGDVLAQQITNATIDVNTLYAYLAPFNELAKSTNYDARDIQKQINSNLAGIVSLAATSLNTLKSSVKDINVRWHSMFDNNANMKNIDSLIGEYPDASDYNEYIQMKGEIKAIIKEGDNELKQLTNTLISGTVNDAIITIANVCSYLADLQDDDSQLTNYNQRLTTLNEEYKSAADAYSREKEKTAILESRNEEIAKNKEEIIAIQSRIVNYEIELKPYAEMTIPDAEINKQMKTLYANFSEAVSLCKIPNTELDLLNDIVYEQTMTAIRSYKESAEKVDIAYNEFMRFIASASNDVSSLYISMTTANEIKIDSFISNIEQDKERMKTNFEQSNDIMKTLYSNSELEQLNLQIKNLYKQTFNSSDSKYNVFLQSKQVYEKIAAAGATTFQEINNISNAFNKVDAAMTDLSVAVDESNNLIAKFVIRVEEVKIEQITEKERIRRESDTSNYNSQYNTIALAMKTKYQESVTLAEEIDKKSLEAFDVDSLFASSFEELLTFSGNTINESVSSYANKAYVQKSKYESLIATCNAMATAVKTDIETLQNQLKQLNEDATVDDVYARPSIDDVKKRNDAILIPNTMELRKRYDEAITCYNDMSANVATAYDIASTVDARFASYKVNSIDAMLNVLSSFDKALDDYSHQTDDIYQSIIDSSNMVYCRYAELYNAIIAPSTGEYIPESHNDTSCSKVVIQSEYDIKTLYSTLTNQWKEVFAYASKKQINAYNTIIADIQSKLEKLKKSTETIDAYINTYETLTRSLIHGEIDGFKSEYATLQANRETISLSDATKTRDIATTAYNECTKLLNNETSAQFDAIKTSCETTYAEIASSIYGELTDFINVISMEVVVRKKDIIRFTNAAKLLAYIFGHYYIGRYMPEDGHEIPFTSGSLNTYLPWEQWLYAELKSCVAELPFETFKTLCLYTPILPLAWPYGSSNIEKTIQLAYNTEKSRVTGVLNGLEFAMNKKADFETYITTELVRYMFDAIVNTMDKTVYSPLEDMANTQAEMQTIEIMKSQNIDSVEVEDTQTSTIDTKTMTINDFLDADAEYKTATAEYERLKKEYDENMAIWKRYEVAMTYNGDDADLLADKRKGETAKEKCDDLKPKIEAQQAIMSERYEIQRTSYESAFKQFETSAAASSYFTNFINEARNLADKEGNRDLEFANLCFQYLDATETMNRYHNYWKLLVFGTDKLANVTYTPTFFPAAFPLTNPKAEKREAVITILNRIFSKFGYPTYDIAISPELATTAVPYDDAMNSSIEFNVIQGGLCIGYYDGVYYNNRMHLDDNGLVNENTMFDMTKLIEPSKLIVKDSSDFSLTQLDANMQPKKRTVSNTYVYYLAYVNPTAIFDFLFQNKVAIETLGLDCIGIDNYLHSTKSHETLIKELVDSCVDTFSSKIPSTDKLIDNIRQSTDYVTMDKCADITYSKGLGYALQWTLVFPKLDNSKIENLGYYPISKINTVTYNTPIIRGDDKQASGFGNCIYDIFSDIKQLSKTDVTNTANVKRRAE